MSLIRRLVICLDGTWNNRDDSTNVLSAFSLARQCENLQQGEDTVTQRRFYQEGIGTGPLDGITGGGFGFGIEEHVRQAYDWLAQNYQEGDKTLKKQPDEIYIFGFSRGAYTARSLVGFISMCGLLRRGAPLTVNQLWKNYCVLGLEREKKSGGLVERIFGTPPRAFRRISDLVLDPWSPKAKAAGGTPVSREGITLDPSTEELLVKWSRRVKITYLGIYDTVGAVGWDALAIPGLRSRLAVHHNLRPTTIIQKCRHALAIDEHRSSFGHTPFVAYIGEATSSDDERCESADSADLGQFGELKMRSSRWRGVERMWDRKIEQRWFVGAHSNIGGGYPDNRLAQRPLEWIMEGAREAGLLHEDIPPVTPPTPIQSSPRDSYAEFIAPLWTMVFRAKRNYRVIDPSPELRANPGESKNKGVVQPGFSLVNVHETVDDSVLDYWNDAGFAPANLIERASRESEATGTRKAKWDALAGKAVANRWPGAGFSPFLALTLWATLAAAGIAATDYVFKAWPVVHPSWLLFVVAALFPLVDWGEAWLNADLAKNGVTPWRRAALDSIYWTRALGVVLFFFGFFGAIIHLANAGWHTRTFAEAGIKTLYLLRAWGPVALCAAAGVFAAHLLNQRKSKRLPSKPAAAGTLRVKMLGIASGPIIVVVTIGLAMFLAHILGHVITGALGREQEWIARLPAIRPSDRMPGLLLLLQLSMLYFSRAFAWVRGPTDRANLGSIAALQWCVTPASVKSRLDRWCAMLGNRDGDSECHMAAIVREALWRDCLGFIPLYASVMLLGLYLASRTLHWEDHWAPFAYLWFLAPVVAMAADYCESACHFCYLRRHRDGETPPAALTVFSVTMTAIRSLVFVFGYLIVLLAILCASGHIAVNPREYGWRGLIALAITTAALLLIGGVRLWGWIYRFLNKYGNEQVTIGTATSADAGQGAGLENGSMRSATPRLEEKKNDL